MKPNCLSVLLACALCSSALRIPFGHSRAKTLQRRKFGTSITKPVVNAVQNDDDASLSTVNDMLYMANITLGGTDYVVQLDTGSSDLWIKGTSFPLSNVTHTSMQYNQTYGSGWAFGNISTTEVEFAGITISEQAFLDVSAATNPALSYGAQGILGLGFTSLSVIDSTVNGTGGDWGRSLLYNAFLDNPDEGNYITFVLQRSTESDDDVQGAFTIGEIDGNYTDIGNSPSLSTWPVNSPKRWNILLEAFMVGTNTYSVSTNVSGAPSNNAVALLDSGTSYSYCSVDIAQNIYGSINGATYDDIQGFWTVPCDAEVDMALQFGGQVYPLHPLDVVDKSSATSNSCIGTFIPQAVSVGSGQFDWLVGDNFLRSVYSMYDFGDFNSDGSMGDPYIKLLSITDPDEASAEFVAARGGTARSNITYNVAGASSSSSGSTSVSVTDSTADKLSKLVDYIPAMLAIMGLNAIALLVVAGAGVSYMFCRRRKRSSKKERALLALNARSPTPFPGSSSGDGAVDLGDGHQYARVASNEREPEDTPFMPPEPTFQAHEGDTLRPLHFPGARSRSTFGGMEVPRDYRVSAAGSDVTAFVPPSPSFKKDLIDRPKSIA
ncbi:hypothetical protein M0805_006962 [Coniferiporia weirii]|nr:hypothetical protein M0805_006962 [Coniferiporia weirii]